MGILGQHIRKLDIEEIAGREQEPQSCGEACAVLGRAWTPFLSARDPALVHAPLLEREPIAYPPFAPGAMSREDGARMA